MALRDVHQLRGQWRQAIIGIEAYVTPETARQDKSRVHWGTEAQRRDDVSGGGLITHLTMWAENDEGLVNLIKASSVANLEVASCATRVWIRRCSPPIPKV